MIPTSAGNAAPSASASGLLFHLVIDDFRRSFSVDGPEANGMRMHYEVMQAARQPGRKLRELDLRSASLEGILEIMKEHFPGYEYSGAWVK